MPHTSAWYSQTQCIPSDQVSHPVPPSQLLSLLCLYPVSFPSLHSLLSQMSGHYIHESSKGQRVGPLQCSSVHQHGSRCNTLPARNNTDVARQLRAHKELRLDKCFNFNKKEAETVEAQLTTHIHSFPIPLIEGEPGRSLSGSYSHSYPDKLKTPNLVGIEKM